MARVEVLDHGYVSLVETWGSDERVIEAARMSTGKGFLGWVGQCKGCGKTREEIAACATARRADVDDRRVLKCVGAGGVGPAEHDFRETGDEKLLRYLYENNHATPFEMGGLIVEVQAPIFVFREWHRHRTQSYNEMSARYTPLPNANYIPTVDRLINSNSKTNRQAGTVSGAEELTESGAEKFRGELRRQYASAERLYQRALKSGVPKELARAHLPVGRYSRMRASANLRNWLSFLTLRMASGAQWEIRQYAKAVGTFIEAAFPRTWELFTAQAGRSQ